jgi:dTDP-4-dehydrorhamnose 3,5-epimerase
MSHPEEIDGFHSLVPKRSQVDRTGAWKAEAIEGVTFRPTRPVPHESGTVTEIVRTDWQEIEHEVVHVHVTTTQPGCIRAWGLHRQSTDRLFVVKGLVSLVVFDGRTSSPSYGVLNEFKVSERNPGLLQIAPNLFHGWKAIGSEEAFVVNMPSSPYDYEQPDALDLPYDSDDARRIVPWRWEDHSM